MFYTFEQFDGDDRRLIKERYVCVEGDSSEEILQRAEWFGIDFSASTEDDYRCWSQLGDRGIKPCPMLGRTRLEDIEWDQWIIVYKNGNLKSNTAVPLDMEPDMSFLNPDYDLDT